MDYPITPQDYLARARDRLLSNDPANLFYAALELRCCVESRQGDYLDALEYFRGHKIRPWQVGQTSRKLLTVWDDPKIAKLTYKFPDKEFETFFTPVMPALVRAVEKELGALLHAQTKFRKASEGWWESTKNRLIEIYREAWVACRGEHMAPPLWNFQSGETHPMKLYTRADTADLVVRMLLLGKSRTKEFVLGVDYLDESPEDWKCDL